MGGVDILGSLRPVIVLITAIWVIEVINQLMGYRLNEWFGLEPRRLDGLIGIPAMPFLHHGTSHALANTAPLIVLGAIGVAVAPRRFAWASVIIVVISGLAVWSFARGATVVGASGLVFGWFGFLIAWGVIERSLRAIVGTLAVLVFYGGMIWGILPQEDFRISWEAHLMGALSGAMAAWLMATPRAARGG